MITINPYIFTNYCKQIDALATASWDTRVDGVLVDSKGLVNIKAVESNGLYMNGTDNYINVGNDVPIIGDWKVSFYLKMDAENYSAYFISTRSVAKSNGISIYHAPSTPGEIKIQFNTPLGSSLINTTGFDCADGNMNLVELSQVGTNVIIKKNGVEKYNDTISVYLTVDRGNDNLIGTTSALAAFGRFTIADVKLYGDGSTTPDYWLPFTETRGTGGTHTGVFEKISQSTLSLLGTVNSSNDVLQDVCHENINNGFTLNANGQYVPASLLNIGLDCEGNTLANPAIPNGYNGAENRFTLSATNDTIKDADIGRFLTEADGTLKIWDIKDINGNYLALNYLFSLVKNTNNISNFIIFDPALTTKHLTYIGKCYASQQTLPSGYTFVTDPTTGEYLIDPITGEFIIDLI